MGTETTGLFEPDNHRMYAGTANMSLDAKLAGNTIPCDGVTDFTPNYS